MKKLKNFTVVGIVPKPNDWLGKLVAYFTNGKLSHVAIYYDGYIYESNIAINKYGRIQDGVFVHKYDLLQDNVKFYEYIGEITKEQEKSARKFLFESIGEPYNLLALMSMVIVYPFRKWFNKHQKFIPFKNKFFGTICSEFVDNCFLAMDIDLFPDIQSDVIVPSDFGKCKLLREVK